jgi:hypothetical protein
VAVLFALGARAQRALASLEQEHPKLLSHLFGNIVARAPSIARHPGLEFTQGEPACNVYTAGGCFAPHEDRQSLTILVPLASCEHFTGGGMCFWASSAENTDDALEALKGTSVDTPASELGEAALVLTPPAGTALVFGGTVTHAARVVDAGERAVFVASFSPMRATGWTAALAQTSGTLTG